MTITTPGGPIVLHDSKDSLSAIRYMRFNQACARESGLGTDIYDADSHLVRLAMFLNKNEVEHARGELNNLLLGLANLAGADPAFPERPETEHLQAACLAPLVASIDGIEQPETSAAGLTATAAAILATGITQAVLEKAVEDSKKNFSSI